MKFRPWLIALALTLTPTLSHAGEERIIFNRGQSFARQQRLDFAFMQFRDIVIHSPRSELHEKSLFAIGEYFYILSNSSEASSTFTEFIRTYPNSKLKIFALGYLHNIASINNDTEMAEKLKTEIITHQQVALVFRNVKEYKFKSPLYRLYRGLIQIDKITISCDGQNLAEISY